MDGTKVDEQGNSPIQLAIQSLPHDREMVEVVAALLKAGVSKATKNKENKDALSMATERGYADVQKLLADPKPVPPKPEPKPKPKSQPPPESKPQPRPPPPQQLEPEPQPPGGRRPVHDILNTKGATMQQKLQQLQQLWASNPNTNPNVRSADGSDDTPLHVVVRRDQGELVDFLLSKNAIVNVANKKNETPLSLAQQTEFGYSLGIYDKLKEVNRNQVAQRKWNRIAARIAESNENNGQQQKQSNKTGRVVEG